MEKTEKFVASNTNNTDANVKAPEKAGTEKKVKSQNQIQYSKTEERINVISHLSGAVLALAAAVLMLVKVSLNALKPGYYNHPALAIVSIALFSFSLIELYVMSTLYHAQPYGKTRRAVFRRFDHCSIGLLIAGTYAPFMLIGLANGTTADMIWGIVIASVVLLMAILVVVFNAINVHKFRIFCMIAYIAMGWSCIIVVHRIIACINLLGLLFLLFGGVAYTVGILFYRNKKLKYNHAIWHFFVLAGSVLHFVSIFFFVL